MARPTSHVTLKSILALDEVKRGVPEILSGQSELEREVRWVHAGEVPDMARLLKGGELLLTTGIGIGRTARDQRRFVRELAQREATALAIEMGRAFSRVPTPMVDEARRHQFPLVALHREVRFVEITEAVHREIVDHQVEVMRRGEEIHNRFFGLMLEGAGTPEVLTALAETVRNPVVLEKVDGEVLYHVSHGVDDSSLLAAWDAFSRDFDHSAPMIEQPVPIDDDEQWGRLVLLGLQSSIDDFDRMAVERAVGVVALALLRDCEEEMVANRERGNFLATLLEREVAEPEANARANSMGFRRQAGESTATIAARALPRALTSSTAEEGSLALIWRDVQRELTADGVRLIAGTLEHERQLLMVIALRRGTSRAQMADRVAKLVCDACARHLGTRDGVVICIGSLASSWTEIAESLRAASDALPAAASVPAQTWHDASSPDLDRLLWSFRGRSELRRFVDARLAPLVEHDEGRKSKLLPTLIAYCEHGGRKTETARALHIERQSLYHRLKRIEDLLKADLSDGEVLLGLSLAVRASRYVGGSARHH